MTHLLDVNVLIALFDPAHLHHDAAHDWFGTGGSRGWATCPLTELGFVRVLSNPSYPGRRTTATDAAARLRIFTESGHHTFWPAEISFLESGLIDPGQLTGHRAVTDAYLLALSVRNGGALATFDRRIRPGPVLRATGDHVVIIPTGKS